MSVIRFIKKAFLRAPSSYTLFTIPGSLSSDYNFISPFSGSSFPSSGYAFTSSYFLGLSYSSSYRLWSSYTTSYASSYATSYRFFSEYEFNYGSSYRLASSYRYVTSYSSSYASSFNTSFKMSSSFKSSFLSSFAEKIKAARTPMYHEEQVYIPVNGYGINLI